MATLKATVERDAAVAAIARVQSVVASRTTIPILQDLLVEVGEGEIRLSGTDMDMEARAAFPAEVESPGILTASATRLHDIFRNLPAGGQVSLIQQAAPARLTVRCGRSRYQVPTNDPAAFPHLDKGGAGSEAQIEARVLAKMLDKVGPSMSSDETRYYLCGLYLHVLDGQLVAVATDGARLARLVAPCPDGWVDAPGVILPRKAVGEIRRALGDMGGPVDIWTDGRLFRLRTAAVEIITKLIDGSYPDYGRVIPRDNPWRLECDQTDLATGLKRVVLVTTDKVRAVRLDLASGQAVLTARDGNGGDAEETLEVEYNGEAQAIGFNGTLLREIVGVIGGERVVMELGGANDPLKILDPADEAATFVIIGLRT